MNVLAPYLLSILLFFSTAMFSKKLKEGTYRAVLILNEEKHLELPFNFDVRYKGKKPVIIIHNADEKILVDEITIKGDSVNFKMPIFDTEFKTQIVDGNLEGLWINNYKSSNNKIKFKATFGEMRRFIFSSEGSNAFMSMPSPKGDAVFEGKWETTFSPGTKDSSKAIGVFHHLEQSDYLSGTFLTETGDYRYLEGKRNGNTLYLSCFDGMHAYLFVADYKNDSLNGVFYSGATWKEPWIARRNNQFKLADAEQITFVKNKDEKLNFSFPDLDKKQISLNDKEFENKPVIVQIMGSWCPNCMDESVYFSQLYDQYKNDGLRIVALAFEKTTDFEKSRTLLTRLKTRLNISYEILITQQSGREQASATLSALNKITAFPTTLFLNREHKVVKVHTGFSGPATGNEYGQFKQSTEAFVKQLLKE